MFKRLLKTIGKQWHGFVFLKIILMSGVLENTWILLSASTFSFFVTCCFS